DTAKHQISQEAIRKDGLFAFHPLYSLCLYPGAGCAMKHFHLSAECSTATKKNAIFGHLEV
ncbi:hypothetical protein, partial [Serratia marcescens]|uniref:hypothetical protein n=1 Tax=Serratia marcescens TaxID=615 RepID=UPI000FC36B01